MKVVALGGCGEMGRRSAKILAGLPKVTSLVIADLDGGRAASFAKQCGDKAVGVGVDVEDASALRRVLQDADIVANTVGPFYRFGAKVLSAAIDTRTHYFDINDDWEPTLEMLEYDDAAKRADITAVIGMGGSPGMSNMLALVAVQALDRVDTMYSCFHWDGSDINPSDFEYGNGDISRVNAACIHGIQQMTGKVKVRLDGEFVDIDAWTRVEFDDLGVGATWGRVLGHPEPITFPFYFSEIKNSACLTMVSPEDDEGCLQLIRGVHAGSLTIEQAASLLEKNLLERQPPEMSVPGDPKRSLSPLIIAFAKGELNGRPHSVTARMNALPGPGMGNLTGIPMGTGISLFLQGKITRRGVFAPEAGISPRDFFDALASRTVPAYRSFDDLIIVDHAAG